MPGFVALYESFDEEILAKIREYQTTVRACYPGWITILKCVNDGSQLELWVFTVSELPSVLLLMQTNIAIPAKA